VFKNVLFQVDDKDKKFDSKLYTVKWASAKLNERETKGTYSLMLSKNDTAVYTTVTPVFDEKGYTAAIATYNQNLKEQKDEKLIRDKKIGQQQQSLISSKNALQQTTEIATNVLANEMKSLRTFDITTFGAWNCDRPLPPLSRNFVITPKFVNSSSGKTIDYENAYIVDRNKNALFSYGESPSMLCNKRSDNVMWILTPDNKIGIITPETFEAAVNTSTAPKFNLTLLSSSEGIRQLKALVDGKKDDKETKKTETTDPTLNASELKATAYPNPTQGIVNVKLGQEGKIIYMLTDISGKVILKGEWNALENTIDLGSCVTGLYNLTLQSTGMKLTKTLKIIKE
jgi:hypothetical protein